MSKLGSLLVLALLVGACDKGPPVKAESAPAATAKTAEAPKVEAPKAEGQTFGEAISVTEVTSIDSILADGKAYAGKTVRVEGMVTDVCPKRGCWMELASSKPGEKLKFKVTDGVMTFPADAKGKKAIAQGVVAVRELSIEETKEFAKYEAEEYGKPYDEASITQPRTIVRLDGTGAILQ